MTLQDELQMMLEKARHYIKSATLLRIEGDHDSAVSRVNGKPMPVILASEWARIPDAGLTCTHHAQEV